MAMYNSDGSAVSHHHSSSPENTVFALLYCYISWSIFKATFHLRECHSDSLWSRVD